MTEETPFHEKVVTFKGLILLDLLLTCEVLGCQEARYFRDVRKLLDERDFSTYLSTPEGWLDFAYKTLGSVSNMLCKEGNANISLDKLLSEYKDFKPRTGISSFPDITAGDLGNKLREYRNKAQALLAERHASRPVVQPRVEEAASCQQ